MIITKEYIVDILKPVIEKFDLREHKLGNYNVTFSSVDFPRLISVVEYGKNDVSIVVRDNPGIFSMAFAEENVLPLLRDNGISFDTFGYQEWSAKTVYKIKIDPKIRESMTKIDDKN